MTTNEFKKQFKSVVSGSDEFILVYSGIWTFGHRLGCNTDAIPKFLIDAMIECIGPDSNLCFPAYTYNYTKTRRYSSKHTMPETGILPSSLMTDSRFVRTKCALNSFFIYGPRAEELSQIKSLTIWGEGSLKHFFEINHARVIVLGIPWKDACGYLHRIEEANQVPYRYYKSFNGVCLEAERLVPWRETMFVRSAEVIPLFKWHLVDDQLRRKGLIKNNDGQVFIESSDAHDIISVGTDILSNNKYALLDNAVAVKNWVEIKKETELFKLREFEPLALVYHDEVSINDR